MISGAAFMAKAREFADQLQGEVNKRFPPPRLAQEAAIEGRTALHAVAMDTVEGDIQISRQRDAWTTQIARLEEIDNRNRDQEYLLRQLRRNVRELDAAEARRHATPQGLGNVRLATLGDVGRPQGFLGAFAGGGPALAVLMSPWTWLVAVAAFALLQMGLKERIENQRDEARRVAEQNAEAAEGWRERAEEYRQAVVDAANVARHAADALEQERQRQARAAARERRRNREIQDVLTGSPDAPDWRLRDTEPTPSDPATPGA